MSATSKEVERAVEAAKRATEGQTYSAVSDDAFLRDIVRATLASLSASPEPQDFDKAVEAAQTALAPKAGWLYPEDVATALRAALPFLPPASLPDVEAGLDFEKAVEASPWREPVGRIARAEIDRQHRAVVAPLEAKVKELEATADALAGQRDILAGHLATAEAEVSRLTAAHQTLRRLLQKSRTRFDILAGRMRGCVSYHSHGLSLRELEGWNEEIDATLLNYPEAK